MERCFLQLGRGVVRHAHGAQELLATVAELEAVGIHQGHGGILRHQDAGWVDVTDDTARTMDGGDGAGNVGGRAGQESVVDVREMLLP